MKIVNIIGGLGNQMFQYAFALSLSKKEPNENVLVDASHFNNYQLHNGFELESIFGRHLPVANKSQLRKVTYYIPNYKLSRAARRFLPKKRTEFIERQDYIFDPNVFHQKGDIYFEGYWQSYKYFEDIRDFILQSFKFPGFSTDLNIQLEKAICDNNSVCIHIRRGDYVGAERYNGICTNEYYKNAIERAKECIQNPSFFIFSDDIEWCKNNIPSLIGDYSIKYVNNNTGKNSFFDMKLMSLARCQIIANSSFSWWSAYLNQRKDQIIIVPRTWVNDRDSENDIYCSSWIKI